MPEYLAPGVYIEETSYRPKTIEGVSTSTTGFVGPTRYGPTEGMPELITSFNQFERIYGGLDQLNFKSPQDNYMAHSVRAFFDNGGSRLYIARTYKENVVDDMGIAQAPVPPATTSFESIIVAAENTIAATRNLANAIIKVVDEIEKTSLNSLQMILKQIVAAVMGDIVFSDKEILNPTANIINEKINALPQEKKDKARKVWEKIQGETSDEKYVDKAVQLREGIKTTQSNAATLTDQVNSIFKTAIDDGKKAIEITDEPTFSEKILIEEQYTSKSNEKKKAVDEELTKVESIYEKIIYANAQLSEADSTNWVDNIKEAITFAENAKTTAETALGIISLNGVLNLNDVSNAVETAFQIKKSENNFAKGFIRARFPGGYGNLTIVINPKLSDNVLILQNKQTLIKQIQNYDLVWITSGDPQKSALYIAELDDAGNWKFKKNNETIDVLDLNPAADNTIQVCTFSLEIKPCGKLGQPKLWSDLTIHPERKKDGVLSLFAEKISNRTQKLETPILVQTKTGQYKTSDLLELAKGLIGSNNLSKFSDPEPKFDPTSFLLKGGNDGQRPSSDEYAGKNDNASGIKSGLASLEDLEEISIIAVPGLTYELDGENADDISQSVQHLISHCEKMMYRVAVIDSGNNQGMSQIRKFRARLDSKHAAIYYPWPEIMDPITEKVITIPPSGFVTGIYARNDLQQGVHKAPANEIPRGAIDLEFIINKAQQDVLNPLGINCLRYFENRGIRVWGARTISSDPEWKYLNLRRYFAYLERSIEKDTQWVVFENNGQRLWDKLRRTVEAFLENEWKSGHLMGATKTEAYFVRCDRTTMTQNDWDNGRLICLIGVAPLRPAEFVIFRIGQKLIESTR